MQETGQKNSIPLSDEALALRFQNGDDAAFSELAARYLKVIRIKACSFREIFSLEREDLYQEGLLGQTAFPTRKRFWRAATRWTGCFLLSIFHFPILNCVCFLCILAAISGRKQRENSAFRRVRSITRWRVYAKSCGRKTMTPKDDFRADTFSIYLYLYVYALPQLMALFFNEAVQIRRGQNSFYSIMTKAR